MSKIQNGKNVIKQVKIKLEIIIVIIKVIVMMGKDDYNQYTYKWSKCSSLGKILIDRAS